MTQSGESAAILVGFDGSEDSRLALRWALLEGRAERRPVHLVHCYQALGVGSTQLAAAATALLEEGRGLCGDFPDVRVTTEVLENRGSSHAECLLKASIGVGMVVVGCRGHRAPQGLLWGSVSEYLSRHATCAVVTVRPPHDGNAHRVVLGLSLPEPTDAALDYAFRHAASHGVGLTAINVWHASGRRTAPPAVDGYVVGEADRHIAALDDLLEPWRARFPDVPVITESMGGRAASALRHASEHAALLVVGRREHGGIGLVRGSTSQSVLHHARCPVAVVGLTAVAARSAVALPQPVRDHRRPAAELATEQADGE
jgi:nucleotide-binding universal stress UspA family protein